jgi:putative transposase
LNRNLFLSTALILTIKWLGDKMKYDSQKHHRRSIRLPEYDYCQAGAYFVTICTWGRVPLFGEIYGRVMRLNATGRIVESEWKRLAHQFANIHLDAFVVKPNHVHGIIVINDLVGATRHFPIDTPSDIEPMPKDALAALDGSPLQNDGLYGSPLREESPSPRPKGPARGSLGAMIGQFKSRATKRISALPEHEYAPIWQRNYYEHIIRSDAEWERICEYIHNNPARWEEDQLHPNALNNPFSQE